VSSTLIFIFGLVVTLIWGAMLTFLFVGIEEDTEAVKDQGEWVDEHLHP
jgi:hypothetical protein